MLHLEAQALFGSLSTTIRAVGGYADLRSEPDRPAHPAPVQNKTSPAALPPRQRAVLELIIKGQSNKQIAKALGISEKTVKVHVCILFQKLGVSTRTSAAVAGMHLLQSEAMAPKDFGWMAPQAQAGDPYRLSFLPRL